MRVHRAVFTTHSLGELLWRQMMFICILYVLSLLLSLCINSWWPIGCFLGGMALIMAWHVAQNRVKRDRTP